MRRGIRYMVVSALLSVVVAILGVWLVGAEGSTGVLWGVAAGWLFQVSLFWLLFVAIRMPPLMSYLIGVVARLVLVGVVAFWVVPVVEWEAKLALLPLVAVLFVTTLLESVYIRTEPFTKR